MLFSVDYGRNVSQTNASGERSREGSGRFETTSSLSTVDHRRTHCLASIQDECNDWIYASKVILVELTGDDSLVDTRPPVREIVIPSNQDESESQAMATTIETEKINDVRPFDQWLRPGNTTFV
jgi:hypothetical protein